MPRISLWRDGKHSLDYTYFDKQISEMFTMGGTGTHVHKYLGPESGSPGNANVAIDPSQPVYSSTSPLNIQDLLFMENRDRVYDSSIYRMRCHYNVADIDLDLSQFGLMIAAGTIFINFHYNDMVRILGRKLMSGDVLELPHLKDFDSLDTSVPVALPRFYVVQDATRPAEGYSPTWWPHMWRVKCTPMADSQEFSQILGQIIPNPTGNPYGNGNDTLDVILSTANSSLTINDAVVSTAEQYVPESGYNTDGMWSPLFANADPNTPEDANASPQQMWGGYLVSDGTALNGYPVSSGIEFPGDSAIGDYFLRTDFFPQTLFRFNGSAWKKVSKSVRTGLTPGTGQAQRDVFTNLQGTFINSQGNTISNLQTLSQLANIDNNGNVNPDGDTGIF